MFLKIISYIVGGPESEKTWKKRRTSMVSIYLNFLNIHSIMLSGMVLKISHKHKKIP